MIDVESCIALKKVNDIIFSGHNVKQHQLAFDGFTTRKKINS